MGTVAQFGGYPGTGAIDPNSYVAKTSFYSVELKTEGRANYAAICCSNVLRKN